MGEQWWHHGAVCGRWDSPTGTVPSVGTVHGDTGSLEEFRKENEELTGRRTPTGCGVRVTYHLLGSATKVRSGISDYPESCAARPVFRT